ncbi:MAG: type II toxin-antitoxin system RelE/ParE family toxin [Azoarcus sp.]|nr:type II toxin-antitoxin system RelE/ParE family toxin [Azoarcus sp.]
MDRFDQERPHGHARGRARHVRLCPSPGANREETRAGETAQGFGSAGVLEVVEDDSGSTYRAVYTVRFQNAVYVLHCFQKKSTRGIATPKPDLDLIRERLKAAETHAKGEWK